jgi:hypothetical protein
MGQLLKTSTWLCLGLLISAAFPVACASTFKGANVDYLSVPLIEAQVRDVVIDTLGNIYFSAWLAQAAPESPSPFIAKLSPERSLIWKQTMAVQGSSLGAPSLTTSRDGHVFALLSFNQSMDGLVSGVNATSLELYDVDSINGELTRIANMSVPDMLQGSMASCIYSRYSPFALYVAAGFTSTIDSAPSLTHDSSRIHVWKFRVSDRPASVEWRITTTLQDFRAHSFAFDEHTADGSLIVAEIVSSAAGSSTDRFLQVSSISHSGSGIRQAAIHAGSHSAWISALAVDIFGRLIVGEGPGMLHCLRLVTPAGLANSLGPSNLTVIWTLSSTDQINSVAVARTQNLSTQTIFAIGTAKTMTSANAQVPGASAEASTVAPLAAIYDTTGGTLFREVLTPTPGTTQTMTSLVILNTTSAEAMVGGYSNKPSGAQKPQLTLLSFRMLDTSGQVGNSTTTPTPSPLGMSGASPLPISRTRHQSFAVALIASISSALIIIIVVAIFLALSCRRRQQQECQKREVETEENFNDSPVSNVLARESLS